ncbi:MAG TPA: SLC13 family permease [Solirubrobacteraceae bacterium]|nr:SLC13 family permease [Solirubrobacteraceae bacterium]
MLFGIAHLREALAQSWPPFVLVAGLLLIGQLAAADGLYAAAASHLVRLPGGASAALLACLALVACVTAVLNLDTAAVFLTPVLIGVARRRRHAPEPFLYGAIFTANASSLFLPGSNLTNLLVLRGDVGSGGSLFARMLPAALVASAATALGLLAIHRRALRAPAAPPPEEAPEPLHAGAGLAGVIAAAALIVALANPALPVLAVALALLAVASLRGRLSGPGALAALGLPTLIGLFALTVALGLLARSGAVSPDALREAGAPATAAGAALLSVLVNNLPAAVLLSSSGHLQARALLIGLNVGPNLAVTGSLAVLLWWRAARAEGAAPSAVAYSRQGLLPPLAGALALAVTQL